MGKTYHHRELREHLIASAIALIQEEGISKLSLRQLAQQIGVSHNAPYRHFEDKQALLATIAEQGFKYLRSAMETAKEKTSAHSSQRLEAIGIAYIKFALAHPAHYRVMFGEQCSDLDKYPALARVAQQAFQVLLDTIEEGQNAGVFRAANSLDMARVAWSFVHGQSMLLLDQKLQISQEEQELVAFLEFSSRMLIEGLNRTENV